LPNAGHSSGIPILTKGLQSGSSTATVATCAKLQGKPNPALASPPPFEDDDFHGPARMRRGDDGRLVLRRAVA
jgi:hypothetical protein